MKKLFVLAALALSAACSRDTADLTGVTADHTAELTRGTLTLQLVDFPSPGGIFWALPSVGSAPSAITVTSTQYGSLCRAAVDGNATVSGTHVTLDVNFADRQNTVCTQEIRALRYTATIAVAPGNYDVTVVHHEASQSDTLVSRRSITVQ